MEEEKGGRPLKFSSVEELEKKIQDYFDYCDEGKAKQIASKGVEGVVNTIRVSIPYTVTGLASFLGTNRQTLINYENRNELFFDTIKRAKEKIEADMEQRALMGESNPAVSIFSLKNNYNWKDKTEVENNVKMANIKSININIGDEQFED